MSKKYGRSAFVIYYNTVIISGHDCCQERLKGFTIHGEPGSLEIYVDGIPDYQYNKVYIEVSLPGKCRNVKFSNITIAVPANVTDYSVLTLCEVEVYLGKRISFRANGRMIQYKRIVNAQNRLSINAAYTSI